MFTRSTELISRLIKCPVLNSDQVLIYETHADVFSDDKKYFLNNSVSFAVCECVSYQ